MTRKKASVYTYYWEQAEKSPVSKFRDGLNGNLRFRVGNFGDLFGRFWLETEFPYATVENSRVAPRLLTVGSIAHKIQPGDVIVGSGVRTRESCAREVASAGLFFGLRGPLSYEVLSELGCDLTTLQFLADPGLLVSKYLTGPVGETDGVLVIPHYADWVRVRKQNRGRFALLSPDAEPLAIAARIRKADVVVSSSLHGLIFAHSLGVPWVRLRGNTREPEFKFLDFYLSVGLSSPISINHLDDLRSVGFGPTSPYDLAVDLRSIRMPSERELRKFGVMEQFDG